MTDLSSKSVMVVDTGGANVATALRLAKDFGKVWYTSNFERGFNRLAEACPGMGFDEIEWVKSWAIGKPDLYVFPDCSHSDEQEFLVQSRARVWGSRGASVLEHKKAKFLETVKALGLKVPVYSVADGLKELKYHLELAGESFVKTSHWRGSCETHHHINMELSRTWFTHLEMEFGPFVDHVPFVIIAPVDAVTELGYDGYNVDGWFPNQSMMGIERKDKSYIGAVTPYDDLPEQVRSVNEAFSDVLSGYQYRNRWSTEIRVAESGDFFFLDPTCRIPSPAGEAQLANEENTGEIYWEGADGNLVEPIYRKPFAVQIVIEHEDEMCDWRPVEIPDSCREQVFLKYACQVGALSWLPPQKHDSIVGWIVGLGDSIGEAIREATETAEALEGQSLKICPESLADTLKAVQEQEESGVPFTDAPIPEPETVIKDA